MTVGSTAVVIPQQWKSEIEQYEKQKYNILAPREIGDIPPYHTPRLSVVQVNPNPDAGDVYPLPAGKFGLSKVALDRISQAAAITWLPELCGRVDDGRDPTIVRYRAVGRIKDLNGQWRTIIGEKEIDLVAVEDELRESVPKREWVQKVPADRRLQAIEEAIQKEMIQFRKHRLARAQSGAMNRAIRSALALRSQYTKEELSRPFVLPKVVFTPDYNDPEVKRFMLAEATGNIAEVYGGHPAGTTALPPALPPPPIEPEDTPAGATSGKQPPDQAAGQQSPAAEGPPPPDAVLLFQEAYAQETRAGSDEVKYAAVADQHAALKALMERKGASLKEGWTVEKLTRAQRKEWFDKLKQMPDAQAGLPWA